MTFYRCSTSLVWDVDADSLEDANRLAVEFLAGLDSRATPRGRVVICPLKKKRPLVPLIKCATPESVTRRLAEFPPGEILSMIGEPREFTMSDQGVVKTYKVRMNSHRYHVFSKNPNCVVCGIEGVKMVLELPPGAFNPHFNLYAVEDGQDVLMTKDHIRPRAHGGEDSLDNYQTMCSVCNGFRGADEFSLDEIKALRHVYNVNRRSIGAQSMRSIIKDEKARILAARPRFA